VRRSPRPWVSLLSVAAAGAALLILVGACSGDSGPRGAASSGGPTAEPSPSAAPTPSALLAPQVAIVDPAAAGSDIPAALLGRYSEGAIPSGEVGYTWELLPAGDARCSQLVHVTTSCIVITRQPADVEQYGPAAVHGDLLSYRMTTHNFDTDPCLNQISVWRFRILADRVTMEQLDPGCRNSLDDAGFLLALKP
jgi:hypothetical protein